MPALLEHPQYADMGDPAGESAAQREPDARSAVRIVAPVRIHRLPPFITLETSRRPSPLPPAPAAMIKDSTVKLRF